GLSSAKTGWRRSGAAARWSKVRLLGRFDAPLCGRRAKKQSRDEQHDAGDFGVRPWGDGALHLRPLTRAQRNLTVELDPPTTQHHQGRVSLRLTRPWCIVAITCLRRAMRKTQSDKREMPYQSVARLGVRPK